MPQMGDFLAKRGYFWQFFRSFRNFRNLQSITVELMTKDADCLLLVYKQMNHVCFMTILISGTGQSFRYFLSFIFILRKKNLKY